MESSTIRNQKNENSENSRARNEGYFQWLNTGDDDIFVVRYSNYSRPTGSLLTKSGISAKSANLPAFGAEGFEAFEICRFSKRCSKNTFSMSASLGEPEEAEKCTKRTHQLFNVTSNAT